MLNKNLNESMNQKTIISISGMTCTSCEKLISKRLQKIEDVLEVDVSSQNGVATLSATRPITQNEVTSALAGTHYKVIPSI